MVIFSNMGYFTLVFKYKSLLDWLYNFFVFFFVYWNLQFLNNVIINQLRLSRHSIQHYVIKVVSDLRQIGGFLRALRFPPQKKTDRHDITEI
jgi:hypothetical protein